MFCNSQIEIIIHAHVMSCYCLERIIIYPNPINLITLLKQPYFDGQWGATALQIKKKNRRLAHEPSGPMTAELILVSIALSD